MTDTLIFHLDFHGPFRVGTGTATSRGVDDGVDRAAPLPAASLKGLMRASARLLLGATRHNEPPTLREVFGVASLPSPWSWTAAEPAGGAWRPPQPATRVRIDADSHAAMEAYLMTVEQVWATAGATFTITRDGPIAADRLADHRVLLRAAACGVHAVGADRRRGLGWVTVSCVDEPFDVDGELDVLLGLRETPCSK